MRSLECLSDARRRCAFLCELDEADQRRFLSILTNFSPLQAELRVDWPHFLQSASDILNLGPIRQAFSSFDNHTFTNRERRLFHFLFDVVRFLLDTLLSPCYSLPHWDRSIDSDQALQGLLLTLSGVCLVCHCLLTQRCHADELIQAF